MPSGRGDARDPEPPHRPLSIRLLTNHQLRRHSPGHRLRALSRAVTGGALTRPEAMGGFHAHCPSRQKRHLPTRGGRTRRGTPRRLRIRLDRHVRGQGRQGHDHLRSVRHLRLQGSRPVRRVREAPPRRHHQAEQHRERGRLLEGPADQAGRRRRPRRRPGHRGGPDRVGHPAAGRQVRGPGRPGRRGPQGRLLPRQVGRRLPPTAALWDWAPTSAPRPSATAPTCSSRPVCPPTGPNWRRSGPRGTAIWNSAGSTRRRPGPRAPGSTASAASTPSSSARKRNATTTPPAS